MKFLLWLLRKLGWEEETIVKETVVEKVKEVPVIEEKVVEIIREVPVEHKEVVIQEVIKEVEVIKEKLVEVEKIITIFADPPLTDEQIRKQYWDNKWPKADIAYFGRILKQDRNPTISYFHYFQLAVDVKAFILDNDVVMKYIIDKYKLKKETDDKTMLAIQQFVCNGKMDDFFTQGDYKIHKVESKTQLEERQRPAKVLTYTYDMQKYDSSEYWLFPFETAGSGYGDCEDGAILIASLAINAGIPNYKVKVAAGYVCNGSNKSLIYDTDKHSPLNYRCDGTSCGGHAYCIYLASDNEWRIIDWCYWQDSNVPILEKPLARLGGAYAAYKDVWFTFNNEFAWNQKNLNITGKLDYIDTIEDIIVS